MELHLQVKAARKQAGLTQEELAARANVGRTDVSRFERGENVTMKTFLRIVGALPDLRDLTIGDTGLHLRKEGEAIANESDARPAAPQASPFAEGPLPRELALLRAFAQLVLDLTGGG